jgi:hypothetical protein
MAHADFGAAVAVPSGALSLARSLSAMREVARIATDGLAISVRLDRDGVWLLIEGRAALRTIYAPGPVELISCDTGLGQAIVICETSFGSQRAELSISDGLIHSRVTLTPKVDLLLHYWPRDYFPTDTQGDPLGAKGHVEAAQRGFNAAVVYSVREDLNDASLYFQNLTALNPYFATTGTKPDGVVGGRWPELGYQPPTAPHFELSDDRPLRAGEPVTISDVRLAFADGSPPDAQASAMCFLHLLGRVYRTLEPPEILERDWRSMARRTLRQLRDNPRLTSKHYGRPYLNPYLGHGQPDSMVQLAVARPMTLVPQAEAFAAELIAGMGKFYDAKLGSIRRFLPNVVRLSNAEGDEKDPDEVDSWYLYHPLANLGALALAGDARCRRLFLKSLDFAIKVARHFKYKWPILFNVETLKVKTGPRKDGEPGQSDVAGIYAEVMIKAWDLTGEQRYLDEAAAAIRAIKDLRFQLCYQTNLSARGLVPCVRLWRETGDRYFLDESFVFLAGFLHNTIFWESKIGAAEHYRTFLGATCLHDGPYMAIFECFESTEALDEYLKLGGDDIPADIARIVSDYCRHALSRAWYFYPPELPKDVLADEQRTGTIDRKLAIPLEDLYADGQPPGQVGQEIYGAGAAFAFAALQDRGLWSPPKAFACA